MRPTKSFSPCLRRLAGAAALAGLLVAASVGRAASSFFDDVPSKGYIRDDVTTEVLSAAGRGAVVATVRYLRLALDPGRRDVAWDFWPEREVLMLERASGGRLIVERVSRISPSDPDGWAPQGRLSLESGSVIETFQRASTAAGEPAASPLAAACRGLDGLLRAGNRDLPFAKGDLAAATVRLGVQQAVEGALTERDRDLVSEAVPILLRAQSQGVRIGPLEILELLFPGRRFAESSEALTFRLFRGAPLDPSSGSWRPMTEPGEMLPGVPAF